MKTGTVEPVIEDENVNRRARTRFVGGGNGPNDGGGGGGDESGGGDDLQFDDIRRAETLAPDKSKFVTWFLLLVVLMTFGGMIGAYIVLATNGAAEWRPFALPIQVWISTGLILISSITYHLAKNALFADQYDRSRKLLIVTTGLGAAFISSQILVWLALVNRGFYLRGNPYAGFFYILTAVHAVHVVGGIVALGAILLRSWNETRFGDEIIYRRNLARSVGWYWHFMGALWIVLLALLGFWK
ncbi:MAG: cytochrome c oxidase subunit 3 [Acidobacteriota bacterium]